MRTVRGIGKLGLCSPTRVALDPVNENNADVKITGTDPFPIISQLSIKIL